METDFLDKPQRMSQRLEPREIFHNEIQVLEKYPESFLPPPYPRTIPRAAMLRSQCGRVPAYCPVLSCPGETLIASLGEGSRKVVMYPGRQMLCARAEADPRTPASRLLQSGLRVLGTNKWQGALLG